MNKTDRFMVYQNDNTKETYLWIDKENKWLRCQESEFNAIRLMVDMLRASSDPSVLLQQIAEIAKGESLNPEEPIPPDEWDEPDVSMGGPTIIPDPEDWD